MKPLTLNYVGDVLKALGLLFPEAQIDDQPHNAARVGLIVQQYFEDCFSSGMGAEQFAAAVKLCRRRNDRFPRISQIIAAHREIVAAQPKKQLALPERTEAEITEGWLRIKRMNEKWKNGDFMVCSKRRAAE